MSNRRLAEAIERDLLRERPAAREPQACFVCGRSYSRGAPKADSSSESRFCSVRCRDAFDNGFPPYDRPAGHPKIGDTPWVVVAGPPTPIARNLPIHGNGCSTTCANCQRVFVSKGLRCCSPECEKRYRERLEIGATMAEAGMEAAPQRRCGVRCSHSPLDEGWQSGEEDRPFLLCKVSAKGQKAARCHLRSNEW